MIKSTKKKETMKNKPQITILFGTDKDVKKTYVFEDETQKAFFIKGVDEAKRYCSRPDTKGKNWFCGFTQQ